MNRSYLFFVGAALFVGVALFPALQSPFEGVNDHHAIHCTAPEGKVLGFFEGIFNAVPRIYAVAPRAFQMNFVLRCIEGLGWLGVDPFYWHLSRFLYGVVAAGVLAWGIGAVLPAWLASLAALGFFAGPQNLIWMNVGYLETYGAFFAILGAALWLRGYVRWGFFLLAFAGLMKESFVPCLPAAALLSGRRKPLLLACAIAGLEAGFAAMLAMRHGTPYGVGFSIAGVGEGIAGLTRRLLPQVLWGIPLALVALSTRRADWNRPMLAFAALVLPQAILYEGRIGEKSSYLIPANAFVVFAVVWSLVRLPSRPRLAVAGLAIPLLLFSAHRTQSQAREVVRQNSIHQSKIEQIAAAIETRPQARLIFVTGEPWDIERVVSARRMVTIRVGQGIRPEIRFQAPNRQLSSFEAKLVDSYANHEEFKPFAGETDEAIVVRFRDAPETKGVAVIDMES